MLLAANVLVAILCRLCAHQQGVWRLPAFLRRLAASVQVDILCSLCTDLLDLNTVKAEIDRREQRGQFVAGKGGIGGANPVRTDAQRVKRMAPRSQVCSLRTKLLPHAGPHSAGLDGGLAA